MMKKRNALIMIALLAGLATQAQVLNEWTFETDSSGVTLSDAANSGTDTAAFSSDDNSITLTDGLNPGGLVCAQTATDTGDVWTDGAILEAVVTSPASGVRYLRYDLDYDLSEAADNDVGTLIGMGFSDGTSTNLAGVALNYSRGSVFDPPPAGIETDTLASSLDLSGSITVIAKVDLAASEMSVWYSLSASDAIEATDAPDATVTNLNLSTISGLQFRATGDLIAAASGTSVLVKNIRTSATMEAALATLADYSKDPEVAILDFSSQTNLMNVGATNVFTVVMRNTYSPAENISSTLTWNGNLGDFSVTADNAAVTLQPNQLITNIYTVVSQAEGTFNFTVQPTIKGVAAGDPESTTVVVGRRISLKSYEVLNDTGGEVDGIVEPGETFDLVITSVNDGISDLSNISNSLTRKNTTDFPTLSSPSDNSDKYASLAVGAEASTTYHLICSEDAPDGTNNLFTVVNEIADTSWTTTFNLRILAAPLPSVSTNAVTIVVGPGESSSGSVLLRNSGNVRTSFAVSDDGNLPYGYTYSEASVPMADMINSSFTSWTSIDTITVSNSTGEVSWEEYESESKAIGFDFKIFGGTTIYTNFAVRQHGMLVLQGTDGDFMLVPFASKAAIDTKTIRYKKNTSLGTLVVSWGEGTDNRFQVTIKKDGSIFYRYNEAASWKNGFIGIAQNGYAVWMESIVPGLTTKAIQIIPEDSWVTYSPTGGKVAKAGGQVALMITADASDLTGASTNVFTLGVDWDMQHDDIEVTVIVQDENAQIGASSNYTFSGASGSLSSTSIMSITNIGNVALSYTITDSMLASTGYVVNATSSQWLDFPGVNDHVLTSSDLGSTEFDIGFPYIYFGKSYSSVIVAKDGSLIFGDDRTNQVFSAGLKMNSDSMVKTSQTIGRKKFIVTWSDMVTSNGVPGQTFQAVFTKDSGSIRCNYKYLSGAWTNGLVQAINSTNVFSGTLIDDTTSWVSTNVELVAIATNVNWFNESTFTYEYATNLVAVTNYADTVSRSLEFVTAKSSVISYSPATGWIPLGGTANIRLRGDARSVAAADSADFTTTLALTPDGGSATNVLVTFQAVSNAAIPDDEAAAAAWGVDSPVISVKQIADGGSHSLSWPAAQGDSFDRTYGVWVATSLNGPWMQIAELVNAVSYIDDDPDRNAAMVIFYKVTVR